MERRLVEQLERPLISLRSLVRKPVFTTGSLPAWRREAASLAELGGGCGVARHGLAADCRIGKGRVRIIADADFLNLGPAGLDGPTDRNLPALLSQLGGLTR